MNFCRDQEITNDTTCCLFNQSYRISNDKNNVQKKNLKGSEINKQNFKLKFNDQLLSNPQFKTLKGHTPKQKQKISLSKISGRKTNYSSGHFQQKQEKINIVASNSSAPKPKPMQATNLNINTLPVNQQKADQLNSYIIKNQNNYSRQQIRQARDHQVNHQLMGPLITKVVTPFIETPNGHQVYIKKNLLQPQKLQLNNFVMPEAMNQAVNKSTIRTLSRFTTKPQSPAPQSTLMNSINLKSQTNSYHQAPKPMHVNIISPPTQTVQLNETRQVVYRPIQRLLTSANQRGSQIDTIHERQIADSRFTEGLGPNLANDRLKTVQSIYGSEPGHKKEIQESVILVDYFNPSQHLRQQIQAKIHARYNSQFGF